MKIALTGDRPTGHLHLGHLVGSLRNRVQLQDTHLQYIIVADIQALTDYYSRPQTVAENIYNVVEDYLAVGISPEKNVIFVQSMIPALSELSMYYMNLVTVSRLQRNPTVKAELQQKDMEQSVPAGFLCYPVSQAADITAFNAEVIPVGVDQLPMIEQTNEIVRRFHHVYGDGVLRECEAVLSDTPKLCGIDGVAKASKSLNNAIFLADTKEQVRDKVMMMYTDPDHINISDPGKVEGNVVFTYLDAFMQDKDQLNDMKDHYRRGGLGDVAIKKVLVNVLEETLEAFRDRRSSLTRDYVCDVISDGTRKANVVANETLGRVREAMKINYKFVKSE